MLRRLIKSCYVDLEQSGTVAYNYYKLQCSWHRPRTVVTQWKSNDINK